MITNRITNLLFCTAAAFLFCWIAFFNGFPLVYSDTGTYLESGFTLETPLDRPITYGFLIRIFSLNGLTAWTVILAQAFLLAALVWLVVREFCDDTRRQRLIFSLIVAAVLCTSLPVVASELIADVFTSMTLLAFFLLVFGRKISRRERIALYVLFLFCVACHISHIMIVLGLLAIIAIVFFIRRRKRKTAFASGKAMIVIAVLCAMGYLTMMSSISKSRHVFMMGHLVETGILDAYLDDHCAAENISLCKYRDRIPAGAETFIWNSDGDSVLMLTGGWLGTKEEYSRIISETFSERRYLNMHFAAAVSGTLRQLHHIRCSEGIGRYDSTTLASQRMKRFFPHEYESYISSRQSADEMAALPLMEVLNVIAVSLGLVVSLTWLLFRKMDSDETLRLKIFGVLLLLAYVINAAICASLATVANRFGSRLAWMAVLLAVLAAAEWIMQRRPRKN